MPKRFHKHKLLLDENISPRTVFPGLNSKFDVKHIRDDLKQGGLPDPEVYEVAVKQQRILITNNIKHFRSFAGTKPDAGIIGIPAHATASQIDTKLTALLVKSSEKALAGKFTPLSEAA
jgi:predicted nuclease of predicted toxin-antitoxin system